ncbi:hypothetical protein H5123_09190 [Shewanella sp. SR43-4]|uniref:hypothetical protein n=1 Tax=Shewanella sp. SR43-4 TaxID=2760942 RepID=UPI0015F7DEB4|nr:hypothetical protein [Shewanella sp. SR43-4]MBB1317815.1 hypothetical protein [Shewanella sp. SR43-4]
MKIICNKLLSFFDQPFKGIFLVAVVTALNAATFWPLAFDFTDWVGPIFGQTSNYTSFLAMPMYYYITWGAFAVLLGVLALRLLLSLVVIMALLMPNKSIRQSTIAKVTEQFDEENRKTYATGANLIVVFMVTFLVGWYSLNVRFEQIKLNNRVKEQHSCLVLLQAQMKKVTQIGDQVDKLDNCTITEY